MGGLMGGMSEWVEEAEASPARGQDDCWLTHKDGDLHVDLAVGGLLGRLDLNGLGTGRRSLKCLDKFIAIGYRSVSLNFYLRPEKDQWS